MKQKNILVGVVLLICCCFQFCTHAHPLFDYEFKSENLSNREEALKVNKNTDSVYCLKNILPWAALKPCLVAGFSSSTVQLLGYFYFIILKPASFNHSPPHAGLTKLYRYL